MISEIIAACHTPYLDNVGIISKCHDASSFNVLGQKLRPEDTFLVGPRRLTVACDAMYENDTVKKVSQ